MTEPHKFDITMIKRNNNFTTQIRNEGQIANIVDIAFQMLFSICTTNKIWAFSNYFYIY